MNRLVIQGYVRILLMSHQSLSLRWVTHHLLWQSSSSSPRTEEKQTRTPSLLDSQLYWHCWVRKKSLILQKRLHIVRPKTFSWHLMSVSHDSLLHTPTFLKAWWPPSKRSFRAVMERQLYRTWAPLVTYKRWSSEVSCPRVPFQGEVKSLSSKKSILT